MIFRSLQPSSYLYFYTLNYLTLCIFVRQLVSQENTVCAIFHDYTVIMHNIQVLINKYTKNIPAFNFWRYTFKIFVYISSVLKSDTAFNNSLYKLVFNAFRTNIKAHKNRISSVCRLYAYYVYFMNNINPVLLSAEPLLLLHSRRRSPLHVPDPVSL